MTAEPCLEAVLDVLVRHDALVHLFLVLLELAALSGDAFRVDPLLDLALIRQPVLDLEMPEGSAELCDMRLFLVDDQPEPVRDRLDFAQDVQEEVLVRVKYPDVVGVSAVVMAAGDDLAVVVDLVGVDNTRAL